jgi:hypothetical protein
VGVLVYRERDYPDQVTTSTVTDADGEFTVIGLEAPETYVVDFQVPAGGDVEESRRVELRPDETVFLEVDL